MSRSKKDKRGGHTLDLHKYPLYGMVPSKLKLWKRKEVRAKAKDALRNGREPDPIYPAQRDYFD